ncbi:MAG: hypothetical protein QM594_16350 [Niabella sp.]
MKPLILDYKTKRVDVNMISIYQYDPIEGLNIVVLNNVKKPFIETTTDDLLLITRTRVRAEKDDNNLFLETTTKTKVLGERDDRGHDHIELSTKTLVKTEKDDTRSSYYK